MRVCLSHITAFKWYMHNPRLEVGSQRKNATSVSIAHAEFSTPSFSDVELLSHYLFGKELNASANAIEVLTSSRQGAVSLDFLVGHVGNRRSVEGVNAHVMEGALPPLSFCFIGNIAHMELYIVSPELLFLQLCDVLNLEEAVFCGSSLCSNYLMCSGDNGGVTLRNESGGPLTSVEKLKAYVKQCGGRRGSGKAQVILPYVLKNSYSPMETGIAMMYRMPKRLGGFGFRDVALNEEIRLKAASLGCSASSAVVRKPDILVTVNRAGKCFRAGIDYDSSAVHTQSDRIYFDSLRRNEIAAGKQFSHFTITKRQALEFGAFCEVGNQVRQVLGIRADAHLRVGRNTPEGIRKHQELLHKQFKLWAKVVRPSDFRRRIEWD